VIEYYESQTEDEAVADDEAAFADEPHTVIEVPTELVPTICHAIAWRCSPRVRRRLLLGLVAHEAVLFQLLEVPGAHQVRMC